MSSKEPNKLNAPNGQVYVATFYRFVALEQVAELRARIHAECVRLQLMGTILLASEGINSTVCGSHASLQELFTWFNQFPQFANLKFRLTESKITPFKRLKVRVRAEIVSFGQDGLNPIEQTGQHISPEQWDALVQRQDVRLLDTRNHYEVDLGRFHGAENPDTSHFRAFTEYVQQQLNPTSDQHVAMYCTGGIRCEKASAWMLKQGFKNVYQLDGGILNYLEKTPKTESSWEGECFVFDDRVTLDHQLQPTQRPVCTACRMPLTAGDMASADYEKHISCPHCIQQLTPQREQRFRERVLQHKLQAERGID